jgi:hypothetical protein
MSSMRSRCCTMCAVKRYPSAHSCRGPFSVKKITPTAATHASARRPTRADGIRPPKAAPRRPNGHDRTPQKVQASDQDARGNLEIQYVHQGDLRPMLGGLVGLSRSRGSTW